MSFHYIEKTLRAPDRGIKMTCSILSHVDVLLSWNNFLCVSLDYVYWILFQLISFWLHISWKRWLRCLNSTYTYILYLVSTRLVSLSNFKLYNPFQFNNKKRKDGRKNICVGMLNGIKDGRVCFNSFVYPLCCTILNLVVDKNKQNAKIFFRKWKVKLIFPREKRTFRRTWWM